MEWWQAAILGLVEGVTEYLPISSTGHLILAAALMGLDGAEVKASVDAFNIVIQGGAILAVLGLYRARVWQMVRGLLGKDRAGLRLFLLLCVAFVPVPVVILTPKLLGGETLDDVIEARLFSPGPVLGALAVGGVFMLALDRWKMRGWRRGEGEVEGEGEGEAGGDVGAERRRGEDIAELAFWKALVIGLMQLVSMWPGTSRSMMTITGGVLVGLRPKAAAEFSFLLGLPTLGAACAWSLLSNLKDAAETGTPNLFEQLGAVNVLVGLAVATASAWAAVAWLVGFLNRHGLAVFGVYRIVLAGVLGAAIAGGVVRIGGETAAGAGAASAPASEQGAP